MYKSKKFKGRTARFVQPAATAGAVMYKAAKIIAGRYKKTRKYPNLKRKAFKAGPRVSVRNLTKQVRALSKTVNTDKALFIKKYRIMESLKIASINQVIYAARALNNVSVLEGVIDAVKYFDPNDPGTLITVNLATPTFQQKVRFTKSYLVGNIRNNYSVPCVVDCYFLNVKKDTNIEPDTAMSNSLADLSNAAITSPLIYPTDCHDFTDLYKIVKHKKQLLNPGQEFNFSGSCPSFSYDVSLSDSHTSSYQKYFNGSVMLTRVEGVMGHGQTSGVGQLKGGVDIEWRRIHHVEYEGGVNTTYIEVSDSPGNIEGNHVCSQLEAEQEQYAL